MSFSLKAGLILGTSIAAACLALILVSAPAAPAAATTRATLVATVSDSRTLDAVPDPVRSLAGSVGTRPRGVDVQPRPVGERVDP